MSTDPLQKILVTGATGFVGSHLCSKLCELGHDVHILRRKNSDISEIKDLNIHHHEGDITDLAKLMIASKGATAIFHLAGVVSYNKADRSLMESVNVTGTKNVIEVCRKNHIQKLIYVSSVTAIGASFHAHSLNENSKYSIGRLNLGYFETKRKAEQLVQSASDEVFSIILNPSTIYGAGDGKKNSRSFQLKVAKGRCPYYTGGGVSIAHIDSVIEALICAWKKGQRGERYILGGENITIKKQVELIAQAANVKPPQIKVPGWLLHLIGSWGNLKQNVTGKKCSLSPEQAWAYQMFHWFDSEKACKHLHYKILPAKVCIEESVAWMKKNSLL